MYEMASGASFPVCRSHAPRPLSEATEIFDTDLELSEDESGSPRHSIESLGKSDSTSSSFDDLPTPDSNTFNGFDFQLEVKPAVQGPKGPHLFRSSSISSQRYARLSFSELVGGFAIGSENRPEGDVPQYDTRDVQIWSPSQVAGWMYQLGFEESIVEKFRSHDISGAILVTLKFEDLKELDIPSFGKRHRLWTEIRALQRSPPSSPTTPDEEYRSGSKNSRHHRQLDSPSDEEASPMRSRRPRRHRSRSNRRHRKHLEDATITPLESVSIVGIEQLLPKPHKCSKGERCAKYRKQQRQLAILAKEHPVSPEGGRIFIAGNPGNPETAQNLAMRPTSDAVPSVVDSSISNNVPSFIASSDILGPAQLPQFSLQEDRLRVIQSRDPQENVKQFLNFQHLQPQPEYYLPDEPATPPLELFPALQPPPTTPPAHEHLKRLPKLQIPQSQPSFNAFSPNRTTTPSNVGYVYRFGTPCSEMDVPVTAIPLGPISRDLSQSAPPEMGFRRDVIPRSTSAIGSRRPSFAMAKVDENRVWQPYGIASPVGNYDDTTPRAGSPSEANHAGWMKKRKTKMLRHEWHEHHFRLTGTKLAMHKDEKATDELEHIDVDDFAVACSSVASNTKLAAAFKSMKLSGKKKDGDETAFSFQLIPAADKKGAKHIVNSKTHHFAVKTRDQRIDWMRELMLAKALRQKEEGYEINVNGNMI